MKKTIKLLGFIVITAVMVFSMAACGGETGTIQEPPDESLLKVSGLQKYFQYMDSDYDPDTEEYKDIQKQGEYTYNVFVFSQEITTDEIRYYHQYDHILNPAGYEYDIRYTWVKDGKFFTMGGNRVIDGVADFTLFEQVIDQKKIEEIIGKESYQPGTVMESSWYLFKKSGDFSVLLYNRGIETYIQGDFYHAVINFNKGGASVDISDFTKFNMYLE